MSYSSFATNLKPLNELHKFYGTSKPNRDLVCLLQKHKMKVGFQSTEEKAGNDEIEARGRSTLPERFRYLTKEAPEKPVRWPWLIGFAAVRNYISELFFWTLLVFMFGFAKLVKKRDYVSSALAPAAILAAVGEPWVRVIAMVSYLTLAVFHHSNYRADVQEEEDSEAINRVPVPLLCAALAIGVRLAAKWAGYRHLTWMIV